MKISTRGEYGLRALIELGLHDQEGPIALKTIAERQGISEAYLEQLFASLRKAGIVSSVRGVLGGYNLSRPPSEITMGDVMRVLEGPIAPVECVGDEKDGNGSCRNSHHCATRVLWQRLKDSITEVLDATTLGELINVAKDLNSSQTMYYI